MSKILYLSQIALNPCMYLTGGIKTPPDPTTDSIMIAAIWFGFSKIICSSSAANAVWTKVSSSFPHWKNHGSGSKNLTKPLLPDSAYHLLKSPFLKKLLIFIFLLKKKYLSILM